MITNEAYWVIIERRNELAIELAQVKKTLETAKATKAIEQVVVQEKQVEFLTLMIEELRQLNYRIAKAEEAAKKEG
ncbi:hypothetical protein [Microscilla marina]|uniref:Uncharacterized protein n=1 Tax=Microscilla marina ATCC 23134 TaxID=313606 RepID=A1ZIP2_MICM2|nr:hypothetical protein [Microscilla marina]EAY29910.1 hypothetical protein M23134_05783 [Microscilla marina ATCC 23134]